MSNQDKNNEIINEEIIHYPLEELMGNRFGRYAKYIIQERALPDVRDGLKPVQRRILFAMNVLNITSTKAHKKSARIVGEVIGKYHPHGDTSVYDALVRMSQWWKLGEPLIDMQGNNGSIDGDGAAAMRYTEIRLTKIADLLLMDIEKNTVQFAPNFDDSEKEPTVLPAYFPNILVNGASGIAAGYATNMPPHNLGEIIDATIAFIKNPKIKFNEILKIIKGPDFPTGGIIRGNEGINSALATGRGKIILQSKLHIKNHNIIIDEIPYEVIKQDLVRKIGDVVDANPNLKIKEVRDETDRTGLRIVIELANDADIDIARKFLLKNTPMQISYNYNNVVIVNKQPKQIGVKEILKAYVKHYEKVFTNRSQFELDKATKRKTIIDGLIKAISILDQVILIIRNSKNRTDAIQNLISQFDFLQIQAEAIVDLRLYRLTSTDIVLLQEEKSELETLIEKLQKIISNKNILDNEIILNLEKVKREFATARKTVVDSTVENLDVKLEKTIVEKNYLLYVSQDGYMKAIDPATVGKNSFDDFKRKPGDIWISAVEVSTLDYLLMICSNGTYYSIPIYKIQPSKWKDIGMHINKIATMSGNDKILAAIIVKKFENAKQEILLSTKNGMIKRVPIYELETKMYSKSFRIMKLQDDDKIVSASLVTSKTKFVIMVTQQGYVVRYNISEIPSIGVNAKGVKSTTAKDDFVIAGKAFESGNVLYITNKGNIKKVKLELVPLMARPKRGVRLYPQNKRKDELVTHLFNAREIDKINVLNEADELLQYRVSKFRFATFEETNSDLDIGLITDATLEKQFIVQNNDTPVKAIPSIQISKPEIKSITKTNIENTTPDKKVENEDTEELQLNIDDIL
ncbi:DNA topoisomerase IV subunit A [Spiroplasma endosymbiont of Labia minor]|uniref:DNA topoisomerase IV subunit A n=1 Tax=Spiroplasma endosymbiont of Labia minor TaxID=3066305 RepID=UPI0030CF58F3